MKTFSKNSGITIMELIVVLAIAGVIFGITISSLSTYKTHRAVIADTESVIETIREARNLTLVSKNGLAYGVRFGSTSITRFAGSTYDVANADNQILNLSSGVTLTATLPDGGDLVFSRLSGETNQSTTTVIQLKGASTSTTTIRVYRTGTVELSK